MSLFVGNISKKMTNQQFEEAFKTHGNCKIDMRKGYAFIQYESERCAEEARKSLQNANFGGLRLNIEWSKNSGRFNENRSKMDNRGGRRRRSPSRERSWRKDDRQFRRSPSHEKRYAPTYSDNEEDLDTFTSICPRDTELLTRLRGKREEGEMIDDRHNRKSEKVVKEDKSEKINKVEKAEVVEKVEEIAEEMELEAGEAI